MSGQYGGQDYGSYAGYDAYQGAQDAGSDPYAPFYYWDHTTGKWEFDYNGYQQTYGSAYANAGASSSSAGPSMRPEDYVRQAQQASVYDYRPGRAGRNTEHKVAGHLKKGETRETVLRRAAGKLWEDQTLLDWDPTHKRLFVGDLGNDVFDDTLARAFEKYPSFSKARVVRKKSDGKSKGYGFVAFADPEDFLRAWKEMDGKYIAVSYTHLTLPTNREV